MQNFLKVELKMKVCSFTTFVINGKFLKCVYVVFFSNCLKFLEFQLLTLKSAAPNLHYIATALRWHSHKSQLSIPTRKKRENDNKKQFSPHKMNGGLLFYVF